MGGRRVRAFHIADLHMRSLEGPQAERARLEAVFRWRVLGEKWAANLAELRRDGVPFDLVVFTLRPRRLGPPDRRSTRVRVAEADVRSAGWPRPDDPARGVGVVAL